MTQPREDTAAPATDRGTTTPAGEGIPDQQLAAEAAAQTSSDLKVEPVYEREG